MLKKIRSEKRIYLQLNSGKIIKFLHLQQGQNYLHMYFTGLDNKTPKVLKYWEEIGLRQEDLESVRYSWKDLRTYPISKKLIYISFHPERKCFRLQFEGNFESELKLEESIGNFIDFVVMSDFPDQYNVKLDDPKENSLLLRFITTNSMWLINGTFVINSEITKHPLIGAIFKNEDPNDVIYKNVLLCTYKPQPYIINNTFTSSRPRGTLLTFIFHLKNNTYTRKGFMLG
jgi:hypothetical protein